MGEVYRARDPRLNRDVAIKVSAAQFSERFEREADKSRVEKSLAIAAIQRDTALARLDRYYAEAMAAIVDEQRRAAATEILGTGPEAAAKVVELLQRLGIVA